MSSDINFRATDRKVRIYSSSPSSMINWLGSSCHVLAFSNIKYINTYCFVIIMRWASELIIGKTAILNNIYRDSLMANVVINSIVYMVRSSMQFSN